jgi:hypothetical protein
MIPYPSADGNQKTGERGLMSRCANHEPLFSREPPASADVALAGGSRLND